MRELKLPEDLCHAVEKKFAGRFDGVEELLLFVLRDLSADDASADRTELRILEERLRDLGYI